MTSAAAAPAVPGEQVACEHVRRAASGRRPRAARRSRRRSPANGAEIGPGRPGRPRRRAARDRGRARGAAAGWARLTAFERAAKMHAVGDLIEARRDELARTLTLDQGKPLHAEAYDEVDELVEYWRMAAEDAKRLGGELPNSISRGQARDAGAPPARRGRRDQPVELALHDARRAARAGARRGQHRRLDAGALDRGLCAARWRAASSTPTCRPASSTSSPAPARSSATRSRATPASRASPSSARPRPATSSPPPRPARRRCSRWAATARSW